MSEDQEFKVKSQALQHDLSEIVDQLQKAKKDNLCIRLAYERWKQTYECLKENIQSDS